MSESRTSLVRGIQAFPRDRQALAPHVDRHLEALAASLEGSPDASAKLRAVQGFLAGHQLPSALKTLDEVVRDVADLPSEHADALLLRIALLRLRDADRHRAGSTAVAAAELGPRAGFAIDGALATKMHIQAASLTVLNETLLPALAEANRARVTGGAAQLPDGTNGMSPADLETVGRGFLRALNGHDIDLNAWTGGAVTPREFRELAAAFASSTFRAAFDANEQTESGASRLREACFPAAFSAFWSQFKWTEQAPDLATRYRGVPLDRALFGQVTLAVSEGSGTEGPHLTVNLFGLSGRETERLHFAVRHAFKAGRENVPGFDETMGSVYFTFVGVNAASVASATAILDWVRRGRTDPLPV